MGTDVPDTATPEPQKSTEYQQDNDVNPAETCWKFRLGAWRADLQDVDCRAGRGISRTVLTRLGAGDWIRNAHNLAVYGQAGCGKSFLLCALAHQACWH